jgi:hypothetical protein
MNGLRLSLLIASLAMMPAVAQTAQTSQAEPEQVCLSEILIRVPSPSDRMKAADAKHIAEELHKTIKLGGAFADLASASSQGPSAARGGVLGCFKRGQLAKPLEEQVFRMKVGEISDVLTTKQGFVILQVTGHELESLSELVQQTVQGVLSTGVMGKVVDNSEHAPIRNAYVFAHRDGGTDVYARTDARGHYAVSLPLGIYDVFISADGFSPMSRKVWVTPNGMMVFDAVLEFNDLGMEHQASR